MHLERINSSKSPTIQGIFVQINLRLLIAHGPDCEMHVCITVPTITILLLTPNIEHPDKYVFICELYVCSGVTQYL